MNSRMKPGFRILGILCLTALLLGAAQAQPSDQAREEFHQKYALSATGRVEVANVNGFIHVIAADVNEVKVDAVKQASSPERLKECQIVVDAKPDSIRIETKYPESWFGHSGSNASVDYTITVPRQAQLAKLNAVNGTLTVDGAAGSIHGSAVNGSVKASDVRGRVDLSSVNGSVEVAVTANGKEIRLHSVNGRISLTMPSDNQAEVQASTVNGSIRNDYGLSVDKSRFGPGSKMKGRLGDGSALVKLDTVNGNIELHHATDGKPLSKVTDLSNRHDDEHRGEPI
jgi:DUF4097 and DUF4098 domain-containing protein YvlB